MTKSNKKHIITLEEFKNKNHNFVFKDKGKQILLIGVKGLIFALDNRCPHEGYPLSKGYTNQNCVLTCNWHNWKFNLNTGECLLGEDNVRKYDVNIENGNIFINDSLKICFSILSVHVFHFGGIVNANFTIFFIKNGNLNSSPQLPVVLSALIISEVTKLFAKLTLSLNNALSDGANAEY